MSDAHQASPRRGSQPDAAAQEVAPLTPLAAAMRRSASSARSERVRTWGRRCGLQRIDGGHDTRSSCQPGSFGAAIGPAIMDRHDRRPRGLSGSGHAPVARRRPGRGVRRLFRRRRRRIARHGIWLIRDGGWRAHNEGGTVHHDDSARDGGDDGAAHDHDRAVLVDDWAGPVRRPCEPPVRRHRELDLPSRLGHRRVSGPGHDGYRRRWLNDARSPGPCRAAGV